VLVADANGWEGTFVFGDKPSILANTTVRKLLPLSDSLAPPKDVSVAVSGLDAAQSATGIALRGQRDRAPSRAATFRRLNIREI
jgi:hypothetical protein